MRLQGELRENVFANKVFLGPFYLTLAPAIWGGMYVISKNAFAEIPPMTLLFIRLLMASFVMGVICWHRRIPISLKRYRGLLFQVGFFGYFIAFSFMFLGTESSSAHMGSLITALVPVFLSVFGVLLLKEKMTIRQGVALILGLVGVIVIAGFTGSQVAGTNIWAIFLLLLAPAAFGYCSIISRKLSGYYSPIQLTTVGIWIATVLTFPTIFFEIGDWNISYLLTGPMILSSLYLGVMATAVALLCWNQGMKLMPSHRAGLFYFIQPMVGSLFGWMFLHEQVTVSFFIGGLLIVSGVCLSIQRRKG